MMIHQTQQENGAASLVTDSGKPTGHLKSVRILRTCSLFFDVSETIRKNYVGYIFYNYETYT